MRQRRRPPPTPPDARRIAGVCTDPVRKPEFCSASQGPSVLRMQTRAPRHIRRKSLFFSFLPCAAERRRRGQAESWLSSASSSLSSEVEEVEVLSEGRPFARGWGEERCGCLRAGLDACSDPVECLALKLRHHQTLAERSALGATAAGLAGSSRASSWDYGLSCLCFTLDDLLICVAERCVAKTNAASFSSPPPPEFAAVADAGVSLFDAHSGERVALALHGQLRRAVSCMRPHPACAQLLLVAVYDGDVVLLDLTDARAAALAVRKSSGEAPVQPTKAFSGASQRASVFCPALRRLRLGTQCCWLDAEWAPGGSQAALGHRFGCVSFFGFGESDACCSMH